jgi:hypothetical protein
MHALENDLEVFYVGTGEDLLLDDVVAFCVGIVYGTHLLLVLVHVR